MAYQSKAKPDGYQVVRTPAPDAVDNIRGPTGQGYGTAGGPNNPSSVAPGHAVESTLAANLRQSGSDGILEKVIAGGLRGDAANQGPLAGTGIDVEERTISAAPYSPVFGAVRQQDPAKVFGSKLPTGIDKTDAPSPAAAVQVPGKTRD